MNMKDRLIKHFETSANVRYLEQEIANKYKYTKARYGVVVKLYGYSINGRIGRLGYAKYRYSDGFIENALDTLEMHGWQRVGVINGWHIAYNGDEYVAYNEELLIRRA